MNAGKIDQIQKLTSTNYETWKIQMKSVLRFNDLWKYVDGKLLKPAEDNGEWTSKDEKAIDLIILSIQPDQFNYVKNATTSTEVWNLLKDIYESKNPMRQCVLFKQLFRLKKSQNETMSEFLNEFMRIGQQLEQCDLKLPENLLTIWLLNALPSEYENFCIAIESREKMPSLEELKTKLLEEEARRSQYDREDAPNKTEALLSKKNGILRLEKQEQKNTHTERGKRQNYKCYTCNKIGHISKYCKTKRKQYNDFQNKDNDAMQATAFKINLQKPKIWCLDSGATMHMCNDERRFKNLDKKQTTKIYTATESEVESKGTGDVEIKVQTSGDKSGNIKLENTILVPDFKSNLLSVTSITDHGYKVIFHKNYANVVKENGISDGPVCMKAKRENGLYLVEETSSKQFAQMTKIHDNDLLKWHHRLGHLNFTDLKKMKNMVKGLNGKMNGQNITCEICCKSKIHQLPYTKSTTREKEILGLVHSDICGPIQTPSLGGARYFATFIDDKTRHIEVVMLKERSEIFKAFKEYKAKAERLTGHVIKKIRTDNAREYLSKNFTNFLKDEGIMRQLSVEYTPQQNGVAERANRTLVEMARCMILQAQMPFSLWAEAINMAAHIRNRCPTKALDDATPHEKWSGNKPYIGYMRMFGSRVIALQKRYQRNKFAPKGKEYVLVGYSEEAKAYRLWERGTKTVEKERDVKFLEDETPHIQEGEEEILYEVPLDIQTVDEQNQISIETEENTIRAEKTANEGENNSVSESDSDEETYSTPTAPVTRGTRLRGRPSLLRDGKPGRPKKIFRYANKASNQSSVPNGLREAISSTEKEL